jgi:signal transduction histidine kinase/DNA-binding NarL/FixJ family response regulator
LKRLIGKGLRLLKRMLRQPSHEFYKTVVSVWLTLSVASVLLAAVTWIQLSDRLTVARQAIAIRSEMDQVLKLLLDVETSARGFVITGDGDFLLSMQQAEEALPRKFDHLAELTVADPELLKRIMDLRGKVELNLSNQRKMVAVRKGDGFLPTKALLGDGQAKKLMEEIRKEVASIHSMRAHLISDEGGKEREQLWRASLTSFGAGILGIGAGLFAFWLARLTLKHQERERVLVEAKLQAERNSAEKTVFLANVSHEIRTPMNAILGFSELLGAELREPRQKHYAKAIRSSAGSLLQLINDVLDISKIEAGALVLRPEPTDPRELCEFVRTVFAEITMRKQIKLSCHVVEDMPRALLLDRLRLRQILVNLVGNAVKFTEHGSIETNVSFEKQEQSSKVTLIFEIQDTGEGIPKEKLDSIFQPFVQGNTSREKEGTGLGLAIVRRLVDQMGGTITVASIVGQGSVFYLRLPDIAVSPRLPETRHEVRDEYVDFSELSPATLLIVDDNELNRELMAGIFEGSPHRLVFGRNGPEAIEKASVERPDIVLLDIRMPQMDGHATLLRIRELPGCELLPVIAVTAANTFEQDAAAKEKFNGFLSKPFSLRQLFDELAHFLPRRKTSGSNEELIDAAMTAEAREQLKGRLRRMSKDEWPALCGSLGVNEVLTFADRLEKLGAQFACGTLQSYAGKLTGHAEAYDVTEMEKHLQGFPKLIERLEQS